MAIKAQALTGRLKKSIPAVTWVHGNEALLVIECCDEVRASARQAGFEERIVMTVDRSFQPTELAAEVSAMSLFASRKLIEVRVPARPTKEVTTVVAELASNGIPDDVRLLVSSQRPEAGLLRSAAFKQIDAAGVTVEIFPVDHTGLPAWIGRRLNAQKQQADPNLLQIIAERVEGNLMAADQEIRKLGLLFGEGRLPIEGATAAVLEVARYDAQDLIDAILGADINRTARSLDGLAGAGQAETLLIWHLAECARSMLRLQDAIQAGTPLGPVLAQSRAFGPRQRLYEQAARRIDGKIARIALTNSARADTMAKGFRPGDTWALIRHIALTLAGSPQPEIPA
ncbi:MAG: DNA polymerase III subunit delta [Burkholderiaceae bacterium]